MEQAPTASRVIGIDASRAARARRTGTETYSLELIKALARLAGPRLRFRLYTPRPPRPTDWPDSAWVETRLIPWPRLWTHLRLAAELRQHPPSLLFVPAHVLPLYCPVPAVVTVHDLGYAHFPQAHRLFDRWYLHWSTRRHSRRASHIFADSEATRQDLIELYGADPGRVSVVYLGRDESLSRVEDPAAIARAKSTYGISGDYLLYLGTLHPRKNLVRLIEAFDRARRAPGSHSLQLVIAGRPGWLYDQIFERAQSLGLAGQVLFPGYIDDRDKPALLSGALAYVFPSLYEGFGLPVLEAMACGTPVLTSATSSLPEVAGQAALLVDPLDTAAIAGGLIRLVTEPNLRTELAEKGYKQIERFAWSKTAEQVLSRLKQVIRASSNQPISE